MRDSTGTRQKPSRVPLSEDRRARRKDRSVAPVVTMKQLLESGVHFGHQTRRWNPKMKRYIFTSAMASTLSTCDKH